MASSNAGQATALYKTANCPPDCQGHQAIPGQPLFVPASHHAVTPDPQPPQQNAAPCQPAVVSGAAAPADDSNPPALACNCGPGCAAGQAQDVNINVGNPYFPGAYAYGYGMRPVMTPPMQPLPYAAMPGTFLPGFNQYGGNLWNGQPRSQAEWNMLMRMDRTPQDILPADPDPWRFYPVKELDGNMTSRNRYTIDNFLQPVKWIQNYDGTFYAQRLREE